MRILKFNQAISEATVQAMEACPSVFVMGESIESPAGVFGTTADAFKRFGKKRFIETPLSEAGFTGVGIGAALMGYRPIMVHDRNDFLMLAMDQIVNHMAKWSFLHGDNAKMSLVIRALIGRGWGQGPQHSQSLQALFAHIPGLKVVMPSTPFSAKGLLYAGIFDGSPVIILEHRWLYGKEGSVPLKPYKTPLGRVECLREGKDVTLLGTSLMVYECMDAADSLEKEGVSATVVDIRTLRPLDVEGIVAAVRKTGRAVVADTGWRGYGVGAEIAAVINERLFGRMKGPVVRIGLPEIPTPTSSELEKAFYPGAEAIASAARMLLSSSKSAKRPSRNARHSKRESLSFVGPF
jgi:acetoin:2,6-dichlorophenolindophenol oxidoreductase subunit beta